MNHFPSDAAVVFAGIPARNNALYHRMRFSVGDPAVHITLPGQPQRTVLIIRDIEMDRAKRDANADVVHCPADFTPPNGLSGDRETATAQALAEFLISEQVSKVVADRTMPLIYVHELRNREIDVHCDLDLGVTDRRQKDEQEIAWLAEAQEVTEAAVQMACHLIAKATPDASGALQADGAALTSDRVRTAIDLFLLERGYINPKSIVAGGPQGADCHEYGSGVLMTSQPVIVDIFPQNRVSQYCGDCTRTVVHGEVPAEIARMHTAVVAAKAAAIQACRAGVTGADVHQETARLITEHGFDMGLPPDGAADTYCAMVHGTGHGIGLDVHEPPLLDKGGPPLLTGDAITVEPGLYAHAIGGIRVEDMVIVTEDGCRNLNQLPEGLDWS